MGARSSSVISLQTSELEAEKSFQEYMSKPLLERLCDTKYYTGAQHRRFNEGVGNANEKIIRDLGMFEGIHGYKSENYLFPRSNASPRKFAKNQITAPSPMVHSSESSELLAPVKIILVFRNGDAYHDGERLVVHRHIRTMHQFYRKLTEVLKPCCPITEVFDASFVKLTRVDELEHGEKYLACEGQGPSTKRHLLTKFVTAASGI